MAAPRNILLVDPDPETAAWLGPALRRRGFQVHTARDGSRALELAVLRSADLVIIDEDTPLVEARTLARILRSNPRTGHVPVLLVGRAAGAALDGSVRVLRKPLDADEVLAHVEQLLRPAAPRGAARAATGEAGLEGNLAQLPLVDVLQALAGNRSTGRLVLAQGDGRAEILLGEGRIVDAVQGAVRGEKALFRLLPLRDGPFSFAPGASGEVHIDRRIEELILDGLRQADELAALPARPAASDLLVLERRGGSRGSASGELGAAGAEVLRLLETPRTYGDLLDAATADDLAVARAVVELVDRGVLRREEGGARADAVPALLDAPGAHALRTRLLRGRTGGAPAVGKVIVAGGGSLARRALMARLAAIPGFTALEGGKGAPAGVSFGTLGTFALDDLQVDLVALPAERPLLPLWRPLAAGALAALVLVPLEEVAAALLATARAARLPVGVCAPSEDAFDAALLEGVPGGCRYLGADPGAALRALLAR
jgi:CheY-like chemotaxis protein